MLVRRLGITITQPKLEVCLTAVNYIWNPLTCIRPQSGRGAQDLRSRGALQTEDSLTESYKWQVLPARAQLLQYVDTESLCDSLTKMQLTFTTSRLAASFRHYLGRFESCDKIKSPVVAAGSFRQLQTLRVLACVNGSSLTYGCNSSDSNRYRVVRSFGNSPRRFGASAYKVLGKCLSWATVAAVAGAIMYGLVP